MIRVIKPEGFGNIQLEEVPIPDIENRQVLVRTHTTLISRGSELFRRYIREDAVPHAVMGYSLTGTIEKIGRDVTEYHVGQRVKVAAPHAQYAVGDAEATSFPFPMTCPLKRERSFCSARRQLLGRHRPVSRRATRLLFSGRAWSEV